MNKGQKEQARSIKTTERKLETLVVGLIGRLSSGTSRKANAVGYSGVEYRDMRVMTPYGIAYCPLDGAEVQIVNNNGDIPTVTGVYDPNRPVLQPGQVMLYSGDFKLLVDQTGIKAIKDDVIISIL